MRWLLGGFETLNIESAFGSWCREVRPVRVFDLSLMWGRSEVRGTLRLARFRRREAELRTLATNLISVNTLETNYLIIEDTIDNRGVTWHEGHGQSPEM
jgi:hypothetical protein